MDVLRVNFENHLDLRNITDNVNILLVDFIAYAHDFDKTIKITVKAGFVTDLASVPRIPMAYLLFGGKGKYPAAIHDGLYSNSDLVEVVDFDTNEPFKVTRKWADDVFYHGLIERDISNFDAKMMFLGVRLKGSKYYKKFS
jgi:hypothetical protein